GAEPDVPEVQGVDGDAERFEQRAVGVGHAVRQRVQQARWPGQQFAHGPVLVTMPGEADVEAQVAVAVQARPAPAAGDRRVDRHPGAAPRARLDHPGGLVAEHQGAGDDGVPDSCLVPPVQVGAADPDRRHPYEFLAWPSGRLLFVGYPQVTGAVQAGGPHARPAVPLLGSGSAPGWPGPDPGWVSAPRQGSAGASMLPSESRFVLVPVAAMPTGGGGTCGPFCALAASTPRPFPRFRADPAGPDQRSDPNSLSR